MFSILQSLLISIPSICKKSLKYRSQFSNIIKSQSDDIYIPNDFVNNFSLPFKISKSYLEIKNPNEFDDNIEFDEENHVYYFNGIQMSTSVTKLIGNYFEEFDSDKVIDIMMKSKNWPREEYQWPSGDPYSPNDIKAKWKKASTYTANYGTWIHCNIERYFNGLNYVNIPEMDKFQSFKRDIMDSLGIEPYRTEWRIAAPNLQLAGSIDFVGKLNDGTYAIIDWKCSKKLPNELTNKYRKAKYPINHLDDCVGTKYMLQVNIYRYILEKYYNLKISKMMITSFHKDISSEYFYLDVPMLDEEVKRIFIDYNYKKSRENEINY